MTPDSLTIGSHLNGQRTNADGSRLTEYDERPRGLGKLPSIYSAQNQPIELTRAHGACKCCGTVADTVNGYCGACRTLGANERQCMDVREIAARSRRGRENSRRSSWRMRG